MSQEMNKNEKPTIGKNENVENPLTTTTTPESRTGEKPAEIIYREIRIVEPSSELVQDLKNKDRGAGKHSAGHDKKSFEHDKPLSDKIKDKVLGHEKPLGHNNDREIRPGEDFGDKFGAGKPTYDLGHDPSVHKVKTGPADLQDKLHGERLVDKKHGEVPEHDKDAYVGNKPGHGLHKEGDRHVGDKPLASGEQHYVGSGGHLAYPAEEPRHVGVGDKHVSVDRHHPTKEEQHIGDKYHNDKGHDLGQNLGQGYDDGATYKEKPLSPRDKPVDDDKHLGKKHDKHKVTDDDGHKHKGGLGILGGKKHDHDKPKVLEKDEHLARDKHPKTYDKDKLKEGDVVAHGEKVKDKNQLKEADHIGDKYISRKGWDLGQNLGKKYDDQDTYKLSDGAHYIPSNATKEETVTVRPGEAVTVKDERLGDERHGDERHGDRARTLPPAPPVAFPAPAAPYDERIAVPSAHGEKVYGHELKDGDRYTGDRYTGDRYTGDRHLSREGDIIGDEHRKDKHLKDKDYATEPTDESHKKHGVIGRAIEKVKEKFSSNKTDTAPDPAADKGHHWEKVPDERTDGAHKGVEKGDKHKTKETY